MLTESQKIELSEIINEALENAEEHWETGGSQLMTESLAINKSKALDCITSNIPGHPVIKEGETVIAEFIALVADMRDSTKHLMNAISKRTTDVSELQRVYYETSALLPAIAKTIKFENGNVTEYLGDGVLALFEVDPENRTNAMYNSLDAAKNIVGETRDLVNTHLKDRYNLPPIDIGVGLAISQTLVTLIGLKNEKQPTAFGKCIFKATKLSGGRNKVISDEFLNKSWPTSAEGKLRFTETKVRGESGYIMNF